MFDHLLAKSGGNGDATDAQLLHKHLLYVHEAASRVLACTLAHQLRSLGLPEDAFADRVRRIVLTAAILHDLGKANDHFQHLVRAARGAALQALRHEWITVLMLQQAGWSQWIAPALVDSGDMEIVKWVIAGHHLQPPPEEPLEGAGPSMTLLQGHADFRRCLDEIASRLKLAPPPRSEDRPIRVRAELDALLTWRYRWTERNEQRRRLIACCKACLLAADVAGSAIPRTGGQMKWVDERLRVAPERQDLEELVHARLKGAEPRAFQTAGGCSPARVTFVRAGCGSGKTLLAYLWAANRSPVRRLYICYPTTGTATEGFRGYLFDEASRTAKQGSRLFHSRAEVDLELILNARDDDPHDEQARIESLDAWSTPIVACTVDTVLGLMQNHRRALYAWPAMANAAFVFDEIHSYDNRLFESLLRFIRDVPGVPILLMTASLPEPQLQAIKRELARQGEPLAEIAGPVELEELKRYLRLRADDPDQAVRDELRRGGKVLWVCNTVDRAGTVFDRMRDCTPQLYHSRFKYRDRVERHRAVIDSFDPRKNAGAALAVTTQVAEMSLDLSATMLVMDLAPIPAMIQRLGRLNRRARPGETKPMPFIVVEPARNGQFDPLPYDPGPENFGDWPAAARTWLEAIGDGPVSQRRLAQAWNSSLEAPLSASCPSSWLDGGPISEIRPLRADSAGISVLAEEDAAAVRADRRTLVECIIPMNSPPREWRNWGRIHGVPVAPRQSIAYCRLRGASWRR